MKNFVKQVKREKKALQRKIEVVQKRSAEYEKRLETDEAEWLKFDARRLDEQGQLFHKIEMIRQEKRRCERCDCTEIRRKYKEAIDELYSYRNLPSIRSEKDEKRDMKDTGTTLYCDMIHGVESD